MPLGMEVGPAPPEEEAEPPPQFSAHFYCGQTTGCTKMPLGMELGLSPGDFVLDGNPAPSPKRGRSPSPIVGKFLLCPNGLMHHNATWYGGRPQPGDFVFDGDPSPSKRGQSPIPNLLDVGPGLLLKKGPSPQFFCPLLWPNGWMDQDGT